MDRINNLIYFNNNRTTVIDQLVSECIQNFRPTNGNNGSGIREAKEQLSELLNCEASELFFTTGTTESLFIGIKAIYKLNKHKGRHIITSKTEHFAVFDCLEELKKEGAEVSYLTVNREGLIDPEELSNAIRPDTILVSIMAANNETGVIQAIEKISEICSSRDLVFFSDASQYAGKMRCDVRDLGFGGLAFGAHKMYGPEGIGVLFIDKKHSELHKTLKNEFNRTIPEHLIVGFGKAAEISQHSYWDTSALISKLKNYFEHQLLDIEGLRINGSTRYRLYNTSNITFPETKNIASLLNTFDFAGNQKKPSYVLAAMGLSAEEIKNSYRFSFGKYNTLEEVKLLVDEILKL